MTIKQNLIIIKEKIEKSKHSADQNVDIIAVTKTHPPSVIKECYEAGIRSIGENKIQEAEEKFKAHNNMPGLTKRFIGHLQSNKVNKCLDLFDSIDSIDTYKLSRKINNRAKLLNKKITILLEVNTSKEQQKHGFLQGDIDKMIECFEFTNLKIQGLMTIAHAGKNEKELRKSFTMLREIKENLNRQKPTGCNELTELSMGMSNDFGIAIEEGSTQVRIGTALLGRRQNQ
jgi:hypothetical protein|tara:strand:+ start:852 stop:1541 length:690 start_codon:yes stop_codon:yes gene_type:complete